MKWINNIIRFRSFGKLPVKEKKDLEINEMQKTMKEIKFSFREGFAERVTVRLKHQLEKNPEDLYYKNLSVLLPKITGISIFALVVIAILLFTLHGSINPEKLMGTDKINESNFITYLFLE